MGEERMNLNDLKSNGVKSSNKLPQSATFNPMTVTFINHNGKMFTSAMDLPPDISIEAVKNIGRTVLESIDPKNRPTTDRLVALVELKQDITISDVKRIVIFDIETLTAMLQG